MYHYYISKLPICVSFNFDSYSNNLCNLNLTVIGEPVSETKLGKGLDVKPLSAVLYEPDNGEEPATVHSSPNESNSDSSSFQMDFTSIFRSSRLSLRKRDLELVTVNTDYVMDISERDPPDSSRRGGYGGTSDEDENALGRKKLRLTKEQSVFLEESFKEHNTLNPVSPSPSDCMRIVPHKMIPN